LGYYSFGGQEIPNNTTLVALVPGHLDVSIITPPLTPAVLYQPVILTIYSGTITKHQHGMVQTGAAAMWIVGNAFMVELEVSTACINDD
jgi:hypothetical protein